VAIAAAMVPHPTKPHLIFFVEVIGIEATVRKTKIKAKKLWTNFIITYKTN